MHASADLVTVVIPTTEDRADWLERAGGSVTAQSAAPAEIIIGVSPPEWTDPVALAVKRTALCKRVRTPWIATLDDDDTWDRDHLAHLVEVQRATNASVVYGWGRIDGTDAGVASSAGPFLTTSCALIHWGQLRRAGWWGGGCPELGRSPSHMLDDVCTQEGFLRIGARHAFGERATWSHRLHRRAHLLGPDGLLG